MKAIKSKLLVTILFIALIGILITIYAISSKYDDINILSFKKEYNIVFRNEDDRLDIPIYMDNKNTFLNEIKEIEKVSISNTNYLITCKIDEIKKEGSITYDSIKYYGYNYSLIIDSYDDYKEPIFISDGILRINYNNGDEMNYKIGNLNLFFNTTSEYDYSDLIITKLSSVNNEIDSIETIVGINIELYNNTKDSIHLNKIRIKNKYYELDYMNSINNMLDTKEDLKVKFDSYSYTTKSILSDDLNIEIKSKEKYQMFIPLKYLNSVKYVDRFPIYIDYKINDNNRIFIQDDFKFFDTKDLFKSINGIEKYVYKYF